MPTLDTCINDIYEPGFIEGDPGIDPTEPSLLEYSLDFSKTPNSMYFFLLILW